MDMCTTTTDIIPIINKQNIAKHTDVERLGSGELVYTGMLRTNIATIVHSIPIYHIDTSVKMCIRDSFFLKTITTSHT